MDSILEFNKRHISHKIPAIKTGDTVRVHQKITEGEKERVQIFEGLVIKINSGHGTGKTFTVRKVTNGIAVERIYPFLLPSLVKLELVKRGKTRRSKLYYIRDKQPKEARLKEVKLTDEEKFHLSFDLVAEEAEKKKQEEAQKATEEKKESKEEKEPEAKKEKAEKQEEKKEETPKEEKPEAKEEKKD